MGTLRRRLRLIFERPALGWYIQEFDPEMGVEDDSARERTFECSNVNVEGVLRL